MANKRLNATIAIGGTVARSLTRGLTNTKDQLGEVGGAISRATRRQRQLSDQIKTFGRQGRSVDGLRRQYAEPGDEIERLRRRQEGLQRLAAANVGGRFSAMTSEVGALARRTAMAGTAAAGAVFGIANSTSALGDNVAKTADKLGMGIEELQAYRYAAERSGVASDTFDMAAQRMVRRVAEAAQGTGEAKDAIAELGLSAQALASMTPDEQLNHFADALQNVENRGDRVRLAMKLFDSEGVALVNMLKDGSAGLQQYAEDARRTGYILSDQAARDAEVFQDKLLDAKLSLFGLKNIIGSALMPVVSDMMSTFTGWLADNRAQVRAWSDQFATRLQAVVPVIADLASGIGTVASNVGHAVSATANLVGGFDNLGVIIGTLIAGKAIGSIVMFGTAIVQAGGALLSLSGALPLVAGGIKAIGAAMIANPIGLVVAAIAGAGYLIYRNWEKIGPWFGNLWQGVKEKASAAWGWMKENFSWSPVAIIANNWSAITSTIGGVVDEAKEKASAAWDWMKEKLSWSPLETVAAAWGGLTGWFGGLWDGITAKAAAALDWITSKLEWVGNAFSAVSGWFSSGDDEDERPQLGGSNAQPINLGESQREAEDRGREVIARGPERPQLSEPSPPPAASTMVERVKEVTQTITNHVQLHVTPMQGEDDQSYAQRIAELVMDEINQRQQGALYDG
jgi:hypothetical protein